MKEKDPGILFSIIIVNYNSGSLLKNCIKSIFDNAGDGYEILIYDNASSDDSLREVNEAFPGDQRIRIINGDENVGFALANNRAAENANGRYLHFLNPDIIVGPALAGEYRGIDNGLTNIVYVTSLLDGEGKPLKNKHVIPTLQNYFNLVFHKEKVIHWNIGASLIISQEEFNKLKGWPEDYFMYAEDLDLFYRIHKSGLNICYLDTGLVHLGQGTTRNIWDEGERAIRVERSFLKFYRKYGIGWQYYILRPVQLVFILFHEPGGFLLQLKTYLRIVFSKER